MVALMDLHRVGMELHLKTAVRIDQDLQRGILCHTQLKHGLRPDREEAGEFFWVGCEFQAVGCGTIDVGQVHAEETEDEFWRPCVELSK